MKYKGGRVKEELGIVSVHNFILSPFAFIL
jgi:hypothetical protein